ncbi:MAG: hypothetical protein ACRDRA_03055 [Pseudonocardiaceae bacterium]
MIHPTRADPAVRASADDQPLAASWEPEAGLTCHPNAWPFPTIN